MPTHSLPQEPSVSRLPSAIHRPTPIAADARHTTATTPFQSTGIIPRVTADKIDIGQILLGLDQFAARLDAENKTLTLQLQQLHQLRQPHQGQAQPVPVVCPHCHATTHPLPLPPPQAQPSSPSPDSSFDLVSAEDRWDSHDTTHPPKLQVTEPSSPSNTRKDSLSISRLTPATPKSPVLRASESSISFKSVPPLIPSSSSTMGPNPPATDGTPSSRPSSIHPPVSPVPSSALAGSNLQALCQDLARLVWTSTRPLMIMDQHHEIEQSVDAKGTAGAETSMKTKDKAVMTLEEEEIADPVPDIGEEPTSEQAAAILQAAEERLLRLSDMFQQALHDRDILQNHLDSYYHHMAIDRVIRRDNIRNTGGPSNAATANNAAAAGDKNGGGTGGAPASPPPLIMDPPMSPLGATSFRVGSYGTGSMGYGRGTSGVGGHDFGGIGGMDSLSGRYIGSAVGRGAEPDVMMQFMHMDDLEI